MITRTQGTQLFISIFFLSLAWSIGKRGSQTSVSFEERSRMAFSFSLPSMSEYLGPTGDTDLFIPQDIRWTSLSDSDLFFSPRGTPAEKVIPLVSNSSDTPPKLQAFLPRKLRVKPASQFRQLRLVRKWKRTLHPIPTKGEDRIYRKKGGRLRR